MGRLGRGRPGEGLRLFGDYPVRRACLALIVLVLGASVAPADYLFIQYTMNFKKPQQNQQGSQPSQPQTPQPQQPMASGQANANDADVIQVPVNAVVELKSPI